MFWRFPHRYRGRVFGWQDRAVGTHYEMKWRSNKGGVQGVPFNFDRMARLDDDPTTPVALFEGCADVVTFEELKPVFTPGSFPITLGLPGTYATDSFVAELKRTRPPVLLFVDNDDPGKEWRDRLMDEIGDLVIPDVQVPEPFVDLGDWWTLVGHHDIEEQKRFVKQIEEGVRRGIS